MKNKAEFEFFNELSLFLSPENRNVAFWHSFDAKPAIKDTLESLGVPHTEIALIMVNGESQPFSYRLMNNDKVKVYSVFESKEAEENTLLRPQITEYKFIVDENIGRMVKYLRMLGFDTYYNPKFDDKEIVDYAFNNNRIVLSRDVGLLKRKNAIHGYFLRKTSTENQVKDTISRFRLHDKIKPFAICLECNGRIEPIEKSSIKETLKEGVLNDYEEFYRCTACKKIYWKGSHYEKMAATIESFKQK